MIEYLNPIKNEALENSLEIDARIQEFDMKAQSSSGDKKQEYLNQIRELILKKGGGAVQDKAKGFMEKIGM